MDNETLFYLCGGVLAGSAVLVTFLGLKVKGFPGRLGPLVFVWFAVLVGGATTFAVMHAKDEEHEKAAEFAEANAEIEAEENQAGDAEAGHEEGTGGGTGHEDAAAGSGAGGQESQAGASGPGGTLQLAADPTQIAFDKTKLASKPGKVTIELDNPSVIEHDVAIEQEGEEIAVSERVVESQTSVSAELAAGSYTFVCTVPGHAEAGMEGTLVVK